MGGIRVQRTGLTAARELAVLGAVIIAMVGAMLLSRSPAPSTIHTRSIRLEAGDTLWTIAAQHPASGLNTAQTVELIVALNDLSSVAIREGRVIAVPVCSDGSSSVAMR